MPMPQWMQNLIEGWPMIRANLPTFFVICVLIAGVIWAAFGWSYSTVLASKNAQIELLETRVSDYQDKLKGASPEQAAGELQRLRSELDDTRRQLNTIQNPPRDDNSVYQRGKRIGVVGGIHIDIPTSTVGFDQMTIAGKLDEATNVEFRNLILAFKGSDGIGSASQGLAVTTTYVRARFAIVGNRPD
jgi:hypothetical protein